MTTRISCIQFWLAFPLLVQDLRKTSDLSFILGILCKPGFGTVCLVACVAMVWVVTKDPGIPSKGHTEKSPEHPCGGGWTIIRSAEDLFDHFLLKPARLGTKSWGLGPESASSQGILNLMAPRGVASFWQSYTGHWNPILSPLTQFVYFLGWRSKPLSVFWPKSCWFGEINTQRVLWWSQVHQTWQSEITFSWHRWAHFTLRETLVAIVIKSHSFVARPHLPGFCSVFLRAMLRDLHVLHKGVVLWTVQSSGKVRNIFGDIGWCRNWTPDHHFHLEISFKIKSFQQHWR